MNIGGMVGVYIGTVGLANGGIPVGRILGTNDSDVGLIDGAYDGTHEALNDDITARSQHCKLGSHDGLQVVELPLERSLIKMSD